MTLFLPWLDAAKSHAPVVHQMETALALKLRRQSSDGLECISAAAADRRACIAWTQYGSLRLNVDNPACHYRLVRQPKNTAPPRGWTRTWQGIRPRNKVEGFALLEKVG